jgi:hypothetical protein
MMRRHVRGLTFVLAFVAVGPRIARADVAPGDASAEAEAHIARGLELRRQRRDEDALAEFRAAYGAQKSARALAQIALAEDAVGLWVDAEDAFDEVLSSRGDAWVEKRRDALTAELQIVRNHLADLELVISPSSAEVWLNGALAHSRAPTGAFRVASGRILVEIRAAGFETARRVLEVPPGAHEHETIALVESPRAAAPPAAPPSLAPETAEHPLARMTRDASSGPAPETSRRSTERVAGLVVAGAGLLSVGVGAYFGIEALANNGDSDPYCGRGGKNECTASGVAFRQTAVRDGNVSTIFLGAGAAAVLGGAVLWFTAPTAGGARVGVGFDGRRIEARWTF